MFENKQKKDRAYPFDTGDWDKWSSDKRLAWLTNFRDKMRAGYAEKFGIDEARLKQMDADVAAYKKIVAMERALRN